MAGKNVEGQLELFSLFDSVEELEQKIKGAGLKEVQGEPVMEQCYRHRDTGETAVAAYLDYNRVLCGGLGQKAPAVSVRQHKRSCRVLCRLVGPACVG